MFTSKKSRNLWCVDFLYNAGGVDSLLQLSYQ